MRGEAFFIFETLSDSPHTMSLDKEWRVVYGNKCRIPFVSDPILFDFGDKLFCPQFMGFSVLIRKQTVSATQRIARGGQRPVPSGRIFLSAEDIKPL